MYNVKIDSDYCKGCLICVYTCPQTVFSVSKQKRNKYGTSIPEIDISKCVGCRFCERICPDSAINVRSKNK